MDRMTYAGFAGLEPGVEEGVFFTSHREGEALFLVAAGENTGGEDLGASFVKFKAQKAFEEDRTPFSLSGFLQQTHDGLRRLAQKKRMTPGVALSAASLCGGTLRLACCGAAKAFLYGDAGSLPLPEDGMLLPKLGATLGGFTEGQRSLATVKALLLCTEAVAARLDPAEVSAQLSASQSASDWLRRVRNLARETPAAHGAHCAALAVRF